MSDLDAIRDRVDIVDLIGETVSLRKAGRTYKGLCPFHSERTPSFVVNPERRTWHCFGACATGGDVFSFIMRRDQLAFGEALRVLAERAGVQLTNQGATQDPRIPRLIQANEAASGFYHNALLNSQEAGAAREYAERRGLSQEVLRDFEIGFAPDRWDSLRSYLQGQGYSAGELRDAGLVIEGERGPRDRFHNRLMFPIRDERGRVVGFGGRALGDALPKYLNSPQSPVFDKSGILFALDRARDAIRREDRAVIVEGYLDAITAHQFGYQNVVAALGVALTDRHIALIKRFSRRVALALDADAAGLEAMLRGEQLVRGLASDERGEAVVGWGNLVHIQSRAPIDIRIFTVPGGKDPDEAIRSEPEAWPAWVESALPPFEFRLRYELSHIDRASARERLQLLDRMLPLLAEAGDRALQAQYLSQLAMVAGVREDDVRQRLNATSAGKPGRPLPKREPARPSAAAAEPGTRTESFCLALLLRFPELRPLGLQLSASAFLSTANRLLFELWRDLPNLEEDAVPEQLQPHWLALQAIRMMPAVIADPAAALDDALRRVALRRLEAQKRLLTTAIVEQQAEADRLVAGAEEGLLQAAAGADEAEREGQPLVSIAGQMLADIELGRQFHTLEAGLRTGQGAPAEAE